MTYEYDPIRVLACCFAVASLSGLSVLLRSNQPLSLRTILACVLYNGLAGLTIGLLWFNYFEGKNPFFVIGVSSLAGMGLINLADVAVAALRATQDILSKKDQK
jgi:hypothetical protein